MILEQDGFRFYFDSGQAFIFDDRNPQSPHFHKAPMKAVDLIIELEDRYYFVELKDYSNQKICDENLKRRSQSPEEMIEWLKKNLISKFRDSFLYRWAENVPEKEIYYICLIDADASLLDPLTRKLQIELPVGIPDSHWKKPIVKDCIVINLETWNQVFPDWNVEKIPRKHELTTTN